MFFSRFAARTVAVRFRKYVFARACPVLVLIKLSYDATILIYNSVSYQNGFIQLQNSHTIPRVLAIPKLGRNGKRRREEGGKEARKERRKDKKWLKYTKCILN